MSAIYLARAVRKLDAEYYRLARKADAEASPMHSMAIRAEAIGYLGAARMVSDELTRLYEDAAAETRPAEQEAASA